jgi:hypothetical protein
MTKTFSYSLNARKCEKILIAFIDKKYSRKPYEECTILELLGFVKREFKELEDDIMKLSNAECIEDLLDDESSITDNALDEIADMSNCLDFLFEKLTVKLYEVVL